ncbi:MAG: exonuclease domain-containing protein [Clostridia bacterium]|nr:exonuclease domain-containing protein [Clostridia bacterium]MEE1023900.1 3'-5' exonuclease [Acutalibacteraceae bacterium]
MNFIIFDLEWNSAEDKKNKRFVNEIIEIGAVMLDSRFCEISSFSQVIKPSLSTKLNKYVKNLTHISEEELSTAPKFSQVIAEFSAWCKCSQSVFLTWSNADLYALTDNYSTFLNKDRIEFITRWCDLQKYASRFIKRDNKNQISLSVAAEYFGIDTSNFEFHRALDDSRACAEILRKTFDSRIFGAYVNDASKGDFYKRLMFRPYYITKLDSPLIDKEELELKCPACGIRTKRVGKIRTRFKVFNSMHVCESCSKQYLLNVKFKKTFNDVIVTRSIRTVKVAEK